MSTHRRRDPLARHRVPAPPPELAGKVLAAAAMAEAARSSPTWIDRLWESVPARLLWIATLCALLLGHVIAGRPVPVRTSGLVADQRVASAVALLGLEAAVSPAHISYFRIQRFQDYGGTLTQREQIDTLLEETAW